MDLGEEGHRAGKNQHKEESGRHDDEGHSSGEVQGIFGLHPRSSKVKRKNRLLGGSRVKGREI